MVVTAGAIVSTSGSRAPPEQVVVAVFENRTGDSSLDPLCQQISETIAEEIDKIEFLIGRSATILSASQLTRIQQGADPLVRLGRQTESGTVVSGAIYLDGADIIRIQTDITVLENTDLISPPDPMISQRSVTSRAIGIMSDKVTARIAAAFNDRLMSWYSGAEPPPSLEAYQYLNQGSEQFLQYNYNEVIDFFLLAAATDSVFYSPLLWVALGYYNNLQVEQADSLVTVLQQVRSQLTPFEETYLDWLRGHSDQDRIQLHRIASAQADLNDMWAMQAGAEANAINRPAEAVGYLRLVPNESVLRVEWPPYWVNLITSFYMLGDHRRELKATREARQLFPQSWGFFQAEIRALAALGRMNELRRLIDQSHAFPGTGTGTPSGCIRTAAIELHANGHLEEAASLFEEALSWYQNQPSEEQDIYRSSIALTHYWADHRDEAWAIYHQFYEDGSRNEGDIRALGCLAARNSDEETANHYFDELGALEVHEMEKGGIIYHQAAIAASLDEPERAMSLLRQAFQAGFGFSPELLRDIDFDPIRDFPPFQEWIRPKG